MIPTIWQGYHNLDRIRVSSQIGSTKVLAMDCCRDDSNRCQCDSVQSRRIDAESSRSVAKSSAPHHPCAVGSQSDSPVLTQRREWNGKAGRHCPRFVQPRISFAILSTAWNPIHPLLPYPRFFSTRGGAEKMCKFLQFTLSKPETGPPPHVPPEPD
ncbi:hypothetical protein EDB84DRAFT_1480469 [Lactarius hengduanensis]|nr:hypothetical protein EDB84DRAFT_1480469 [Lactarius hengduanensis]